MSSRKEEKERLRQEREQAEQAARASEARRKRLGLVLGGILAAAVVVIAVLAITSGGGDDSEEPKSDAPTDTTLPASKTDDLDEAIKNAKTAGCVFKEFPDEGNQHLKSRDDTFDDYKTNPPTSGTHVPPPSAFDGVYDPGNAPRKEEWVHSLEHGRVVLMYKPGTPQKRIDQLQKLFDEDVGTQPGGYKTLLLENNTDMPFDVAAVSWTRYAACKEFTDEVFDVLRDFRKDYVDSDAAPEADFPWPFTSTS
jgi:hypothetical protein